MVTIHQEIIIHAPCQRCFDLARSVDFHVVSSREIAARVEGGRCSGLSGEGDVTIWSARFFGVHFSMQTQIEDFADPTSFRDRMTLGLLKRFVHCYRFRDLGDSRCAVSDELVVEAPFGWLGILVEHCYLRRKMESLVGKRLAAIKRAAESDEWREYLQN